MEVVDNENICLSKFAPMSLIRGEYIVRLVVKRIKMAKE